MRTEVPLVLIGRRHPEMPSDSPPGVRAFSAWPHAAVMHAWSRCLFGVAPSIWHEPCPTVVMEAMAQGKPMVVTAMGGMPDLVENNETGFVVAPEAPPLAAALTRLLGDPALRQRMGAASRVKVAGFQASAVVSRIEAVYRELISQRAPAVQVV
jgi:glycosyltransferase involved in cell wall biosynthesis